MYHKGGWERRGGGDESRLLGVVFVSRVKSSVSGEVEWLVPAYHVATGRQQGHKQSKKKQNNKLNFD